MRNEPKPITYSITRIYDKHNSNWSWIGSANWKRLAPKHKDKINKLRKAKVSFRVDIHWPSVATITILQ